jgi:large subunit ribosomal protein L15
MMIHEVTTGAPRNKLPKRKGRGESSGHGKTSGRGNKGSKARTGKYIKRGYEGGQTPIFKRFPKRGFSNENFERRFHIVNLGDLAEQFDDGATVDAAALIEKGLVPDIKQPVKVLGEGTVGKKLTIMAGWFSKSAHQKILDAGGTAQNLKGTTFEFPKPKKKFIPREPVKKAKKFEEPEGEAKAEPKGEAKAEKGQGKPAAEGKGEEKAE